jgi:hypothetical protein
VLTLFLLSRDIVCKGTPTRQALRNQGILILVEMHEALFEIILLATGAFSASPQAAWDLDFSQKPRNAFCGYLHFRFRDGKVHEQEYQVMKICGFSIPTISPRQIQIGRDSWKSGGDSLAAFSMVSEATSESSCERDFSES